MDKLNALLLITPKNELACLTSNMNIHQALEKMRAHGYSAIPVIDKEGVYCGLVSEGDLLWSIYDEEMDEEYMNETSILDIINPKRCPALKVDVSGEEIVKQITENNFIPIVDDRNILMGIVTRKRVMQALVNRNED